MSTTQQIIDAIVAHNWALAAALILVALVAFIRQAAPRLHGGVGAYLNSSRGGSILVLVSGTGGALVTSLVAGRHMSWSLLIGALMTSAAASGLYNMTKDILPRKEAAPKLADTVEPPSSGGGGKAAMLLPVLFLFGLNGCATAPGQCELNALPQTEQGALACAASASTSPNAQAAISACLVDIVPAQAACLMQAMLKSLQRSVPAHGQATEAVGVQIRNVEEWLRGRPQTYFNRSAS